MRRAKGRLILAGLVAAAEVAAAAGFAVVPATAASKSGGKIGHASHASRTGTGTPAAAPPVISSGASGSSPFSPGIPLSSGQVPAQTTPTVAAGNSGATSSAGGGLSGSTGLIIGVAALAVLIAVALFIWYDARRRAPVLARRAAAAASGANVPGSRRKPKPRKLSATERRRRKRGRAR